MPRSTSTGKCLLCGRRFGKSAMTRHVGAHLKGDPGAGARGADAGGTGARRAGPAGFHIVVDCPMAPVFWLHLDAPGGATLADLDAFLRDIWLECCGHLSAFDIRGTRYESEPEGAMGRADGMDVPLDEVLVPGMALSHEYDYGSTTELRLKVVSEHPGRGRKGSGGRVALLARNDPPRPVCGVCGAPATRVCPQCAYGGDPWLCDACAPGHDCGEDGLLPFVNSPRCGVCGYTGEPY